MTTLPPIIHVVDDDTSFCAALGELLSAACSSQRDSDRVFEHKLLSLRRLHFAKALRGPARDVSKGTIKR